MIGKSWDGTIANGVAATGVEGLKTIVPISAISSWYDYTATRGDLRSADYPGVPVTRTSNGRTRASACAAVRAELRDGRRRRDRRLQRVLGAAGLPAASRRPGPGQRVRRPRHARTSTSRPTLRPVVGRAGRARRAPQDLAVPGRPRRPVRLPARRVGGHPAPLVRLLAAWASTTASWTSRGSTSRRARRRGRQRDWPAAGAGRRIASVPVTAGPAPSAARRAAGPGRGRTSTSR